MNNRKRKQFCGKSHLAFARLESRQLLAADLVQPVLIPSQANVIEIVLADAESPTEDQEATTCKVQASENQTIQLNDCDLVGIHSNGFQVASDNSQKDVSGSDSPRVLDGDTSDSVDSSEEGVAVDVGDPRVDANDNAVLFENPGLESEVPKEIQEDTSSPVLLDRTNELVSLVQTDPGLATISMTSSIAPPFVVEIVPSQNQKFEYFSTDQIGLTEEPSAQGAWWVETRRGSNLTGLIASQQSFSVLSPGMQTPLEMKNSLMSMPAGKNSQSTIASKKNAAFETRFAETLETYRSGSTDEASLQKDLRLESAWVEKFHSETTASARVPSDEETHDDAAVSPLESSVQSTVIVAIAGGVYHYKDAGRRRRARSKSRRLLRYTQAHRRDRKA